MLDVEGFAAVRSALIIAARSHLAGTPPAAIYDRVLELLQEEARRAYQRMHHRYPTVLAPAFMAGRKVMWIRAEHRYPQWQVAVPDRPERHAFDRHPFTLDPLASTTTIKTLRQFRFVGTSWKNRRGTGMPYMTDDGPEQLVVYAEHGEEPPALLAVAVAFTEFECLFEQDPQKTMDTMLYRPLPT